MIQTHLIHLDLMRARNGKPYWCCTDWCSNLLFILPHTDQVHMYTSHLVWVIAPVLVVTLPWWVLREICNLFKYLHPSYHRQIEAKVILTRLLQTFRLTLAPSYKVVVEQMLTLQPKGGVPCTLQEIVN